MQEQSQKTSHQQYSQRTVVVFVILAALAASFISSVIIGALFFIGAQLDSRNLEKQREVVVQEGEVIADVAAEVGESVVSITTSQTETRINSFTLRPERSVSEGAGTGIIVDTRGHILTNKHVIPEETDGIEITLADGTRYSDVTLIGRDPLNDLAILKINNPGKLQPAKLGDSRSVRTGQKVIAIGNALGQFQNTVTSGIISGIGRPIQASDGVGGSEQLTNLFQTDAAINPGNSGGPLVNFNGEVIGVNTAVAQDAQGVGFAIPINEAKPIIQSAQQEGRIIRGYIGVQYIALTPDIASELKLKTERGAYISEESGSVVRGGPADRAGVEPGDVITKVNSVVIDEKTSLSSAISSFGVGEEVELIVIRDGREQQIMVKLGAAPTE